MTDQTQKLEKFKQAVFDEAAEKAAEIMRLKLRQEILSNRAELRLKRSRKRLHRGRNPQDVWHSAGTC